MQLIELLWPALFGDTFGVRTCDFWSTDHKEGVIFTDLAIGQFAAVGMALSIGLLEGEYQLSLTLGFALLGAFVITYATQKVEHIEAFIGMLYALGASSIMLILAGCAQGTELFSKVKCFRHTFYDT